MIQKLAKTASFLFHPLLMPTFGFLLLMNTGFYFALISYEAKKFILLIVIMSTFLLPLISMSFLVFSSRFKINLDKSSDRVLPLLSTAVFYYLGYYFLGKIPIYPVYRIVLISSVLTIAILLIISVKWKISAHLAGIGGLIGAFLALSLRMNINSSLLLSSLIFVAGIVGTARIVLEKHTPIQVYAGFFLGFAVNYLIMAWI